MSRNTGNSVRREISIFGMLLDKFMQYPKIWPPIFQWIGKPLLHSVLFSEIECSVKLFDNNIFICRHILHRYVNEDVSLGSWFIGLDVEHIDDRSLCCGTPPGMTCHYVLSFCQLSSSLLILMSTCSYGLMRISSTCIGSNFWDSRCQFVVHILNLFW